MVFSKVNFISLSGVGICHVGRDDFYHNWGACYWHLVLICRYVFTDWEYLSMVCVKSFTFWRRQLYSTSHLFPGRTCCYSPGSFKNLFCKKDLKKWKGEISLVKIVNHTQNIIKFRKINEINICVFYLWKNMLDCLIKMSDMSMFSY